MINDSLQSLIRQGAKAHLLIDRAVLRSLSLLYILAILNPTSRRDELTPEPSITQSSLLSEFMALRPRANLIIPRTNSRVSMQNSSETDVALDSILASRILSGKTSLAPIAEDLIHLLERTAFGLRYLR
jgi:hypothetical protein